jgi:cytochrome c oxidase subunit 4
MQPTPPPHGHAPEPHAVGAALPVHPINYLLVFYALVALTVLTVLVGLKRFENELANVSLALLIASIKAICVARFFMHLKFEGKLIKLILFVPLGLTVLLVCALIPDIVMTHPFSDSSSLHLFHNVYRMFSWGREWPWTTAGHP